MDDVENPVGVYHDDILNRVDALMNEAVQYNIKLTIALHDVRIEGCNLRFYIFGLGLILALY